MWQASPRTITSARLVPRLRSVFNIQGGELVIILLLALVVLGPEKLPDAMRKAGKAYADLKKMAGGFQEEFRAALDEPTRELRETANLLRDSADFTKLQNGQRDEKPKSGEMKPNLAPADLDAVPSDDLPFTGPSADVEVPVGSDGFGDLPDPSEVEPDEPDEIADGTAQS